MINCNQKHERSNVKFTSNLKLKYYSEHQLEKEKIYKRGETQKEIKLK